MSRHKTKAKDKKKQSLTHLVLETIAKKIEETLDSYAHYSPEPFPGFWELSYKGFKPKYLLQAFKTLERQKYLKQKKVDSQKRGPNIEIVITRGGFSFLRWKKVSGLKIKAQRRWDGKWRIVIFDIPEKQKELRNLLRRKLKELGFVQVQKSVWAYPYPCRNEVRELCDCYRVTRYVSLFEGIYLGNDRKLRKHFKL